MNRYATTAFLLTVLAAHLPAQDREPEHLLRLSFVKGQQTRWLVTNEMTAKIAEGDTPIEQRVTIRVTFTATVEELTEKGAKLSYRIDRVVAQYAGQEEMDYDSDEEDNTSPASQEMASIVGKTFTVEVDGRGRRLGVEVPEPVKRMDRQSGTDFLTLTEMILPSRPELPETPVAVGAKWKGGEVPATEKDREYARASDYELLSIEGRVARIRHDLSVTHAEPANEAQKKAGRRVSRVLTLDLARGSVVAEEGEEHVEAADGPMGEFSIEIRRNVEELPVDEKKSAPEAKDGGVD